MIKIKIKKNNINISKKISKFLKKDSKDTWYFLKLIKRFTKKCIKNKLIIFLFYNVKIFCNLNDIFSIFKLLFNISNQFLLKNTQLYILFKIKSNL